MFNSKKMILFSIFALLLLVAGCIQSNETENGGKTAVFSESETGSEILGNTDAKVHIVEYSDLECSYCKSFHANTFSKIKENYIDTGKVTFEYKHYPLYFHPDAQKAAEAVECATDQGKRWPMIDKLFSSDSLSISSIKGYASDLGLDTEEFGECLDSGKYYDKVQKDLAEGQSSGVEGTPTFFINGEMLVGAKPYSAFEEVIDSKLGE